MRRVVHLVLILAVSFTALWAPERSSATANDLPMLQMDIGEVADRSCDGCVSTGFADGILCEGGCPVPCGAGGSAALTAPETSSGVFPMAFGSLHTEGEQLILPGIFPSLDPFPPKLPV